MRSTSFYLTVISLLFVLSISSCSKTSTTSGATLVSPADGSTNIPQGQLFTCTALSNATSYEFLFVDTYNSQLINQITYTNSFAPSTLTSGHTYHWHVHVILSNNTTTDSPTWSFTVQ